MSAKSNWLLEKCSKEYSKANDITKGKYRKARIEDHTSTEYLDKWDRQLLKEENSVKLTESQEI